MRQLATVIQRCYGHWHGSARAVLDSLSIGVVCLSLDGRILRMNSHFQQLSNHKLKDAPGQCFENVIQLRNHADARLITGLGVVSALGNQVFTADIGQLSTTDGGTTTVIYKTHAIPDRGGRVRALVLTCTRMSELSRVGSEYALPGAQDEVTGLINRREFERKVQESIQDAHRRNHNHALCYLDLDQFKVINDTCGHLAGDDLLRQIAQQLQSVVRTGDIVARLGGDEFGVLFWNCSTGQAERVTGQLLQAVDQFRFVWNNKSLRIGTSIGLVDIDKSTLSAVAALRDADFACYMAKDAGRNRVHVYSEQNSQLQERRGEMRWVARINSALEQDNLVLYVQSIEPTTLQISSNLHFEVLVRLRDDDQNLVPPGQFLPAAERYGLASRIDQWVVTHTFEWLSSHTELAESVSLCSINLSGQSLGDPQFLQFVINQFDNFRVPEKWICFEITETAAIANLAFARRFINTLRDRGCTFALDDFGSGLSSFAYLRSLPVDFLKIDGQFVRDILVNALDFAMVRSINDIGQTLGMRTIAEFVENDAIKSRLKKIGVDFVQGYGVSMPQPIEALAS